MTLFEVWAPQPERVQVEVDGTRHPMRPSGRPGRWVADVPAAGHGSRYGFVLDDGDEPLPDPRSRRQPDGVHGRSEVYEHDRFGWTDHGWHGRPLPGSVLYELHVGTFTSAGTFDAAIDRLDHLVSLGVDAVELLPVAAFPGERGWGYDGVHLWAVHEPYGGPDGLKRFVDACHGRGLAVVLDVVYNHLGPSGNYLGSYGPYFTDAYNTPWGDAVNLDRDGADEVRAFIVENAVSWLRDFHLDGLRLDAVHALRDGQAVHILEMLAVEVEALSAHLGRRPYLIAESDLNDPRLVTPREGGGYGLDAQWDDDVHHALHSALTGETQGYYADFGTLGTLRKAFTSVFVHDGGWSSFRGRRHGRRVDVTRTPAHRFVTFLQNHDQIGNRAVGDRLSATLSPGVLKAGAALLLTSPFTPMLFMGEEWGAGTPWCYFTDHQEPELAQAVTRGRRREFADHGWNSTDVPDPQAVDTFRRSVLDWTELERSPHADLLDWHRALLALRRARPELTDPRLTAIDVDVDETSRLVVVRRGRLLIAANLGSAPVRVPVPNGRMLLASDPGVRLSHTASGPGTRLDVRNLQPPAADRSLELPPGTVVIVDTATGDTGTVTAGNDAAGNDAAGNDAAGNDAAGNAAAAT